MRHRDLFALLLPELRADRVPGRRFHLQGMLEELIRTLTDALVDSADAAGPAATWAV